MVPIGVTHISCHYIKYDWGSGRKERTNEQMLGVNSSAEREFCNTLCMCRLTLVWILANYYKATGMQTHLPSRWLDPRVMLTRLSTTVSGVDCLCPCPVANSLSAPFSNQLSSRVPLPLPTTPRFQFQNPLSGFAPKQIKESSAWRATYIVLHIYIYIYIYKIEICRKLDKSNT